MVRIGPNGEILKEDKRRQPTPSTPTGGTHRAAAAAPNGGGGLDDVMAQIKQVYDVPYVGDVPGYGLLALVAIVIYVWGPCTLLFLLFFYFFFLHPCSFSVWMFGGRGTILPHLCI
jgi:hypothetical protein